MYCGGVYDEVDVVCDVFRFLGLAIVDVCAAFFEVLGQGRAVPAEPDTVKPSDKRISARPDMLIPPMPIK